jgi:hypothetical protein
LRQGAKHSLRLEMNAAYFTGYMVGWMKDRTRYDPLGPAL